MIIGFGNKARYGKDTAADALVEFYQAQKALAQAHVLTTKIPNIKKVNFADALKREVTTAIKLHGSVEKLLYVGTDDGVEIPGWVMPDSNPPMNDPLCPFGKHSKLLQWWGTDYRRRQDSDYWVDKWEEQIDNFKGIVVVSDVRFQNEAKKIKALKGHLVNVTRVQKDGSRYVDPSRDQYHKSEVELDSYNWDYYIKVKDGDVALTGEQAITIAEYIRGLESK
jgi:hypothetical protein